MTTSDLARYCPPRRRANIVRATLVAIVAVDLIAIWSSQAQFSLVGRIGAGQFVSESEITQSDNRQLAIGYAQLGLYVVCVVSFLAWFG